jgi:hypothetical protein
MSDLDILVNDIIENADSDFQYSSDLLEMANSFQTRLLMEELAEEMSK